MTIFVLVFALSCEREKEMANEKLAEKKGKAKSRSKLSLKEEVTSSLIVWYVSRRFKMNKPFDDQEQGSFFQYK